MLQSRRSSRTAMALSLLAVTRDSLAAAAAVVDMDVAMVSVAVAVVTSGVVVVAAVVVAVVVVVVDLVVLRLPLQLNKWLLHLADILPPRLEQRALAILRRTDLRSLSLFSLLLSGYLLTFFFRFRCWVHGFGGVMVHDYNEYPDISTKEYGRLENELQKWAGISSPSAFFFDQKKVLGLYMLCIY